MEAILNILSSAVGKIIFAIIVFFVGRFVINYVLKLLEKSKVMAKTSDSVRSFTKSFIKIGLYALLVISIVGILGVPMASITAILASAGITIGLALQGALSNFAGGIMLMVFKPFKVGDFVEAAGATGVCQEITMFYSVFLTIDNKRITVPNGTLMNANVTNYTAEDVRRVDLVFTCAKGETPERVQQIMLDVMAAHEKVLKTPEPFARLSGGTNESMEFTLRAWCATADYWDVYFDMNQKVTEAFGANGVKFPTVRITSEAQN